jgi:hypothetical protein
MLCGKIPEFKFEGHLLNKSDLFLDGIERSNVQIGSMNRKNHGRNTRS